MLDPNAKNYHKEFAQLSQRLQALGQDFQERGMVSDADKAVLDRVQREKEGFEVKLSDAERTGHWDVFKDEFGSVWNAFITDLDMLEVRLMDADMRKKERKA